MCPKPDSRRTCVRTSCELSRRASSRAYLLLVRHKTFFPSRLSSFAPIILTICLYNFLMKHLRNWSVKRRKVSKSRLEKLFYNFHPRAADRIVRCGNVERYSTWKGNSMKGVSKINKSFPTGASCAARWNSRFAFCFSVVVILRDLTAAATTTCHKMSDCSSDKNNFGRMYWAAFY